MNDANGTAHISLFLADNKLGVCCFDEATAVLYCDSISINKETMRDTLETIKLTCNPSMFLLPPRIISNQNLLDLIILDEGRNCNYLYQSLKTSSWNDAKGIALLSTKVKIRGEVQRKNRNTAISMSSLVDVDDRSMACALSALLEYVQATLFNMDDGFIYVSSIKPLLLVPYLRMDSSTFHALQVV